MVHQHFQLIPVFTVAENVILGNELVQGRAARHRTRPAGASASSATQYGLHVDPDAKVGDLSVGEQQRVELVKALFREADILILDEPTAVLTPGEVDDFFAVVRSLVDQGKSIIFITHKLREVLAVADRITVLRGGRVAGTADPTTATQQSLANLMVGRDVVFQVEKCAAAPGDVGAVGPRPARRRTTAACRPSTASRSRCAAARSSASPASRATASASSSRRSPACAARSAGTSRSSGATPPRCRRARSPSSAPRTSRRTAASTASSGAYTIADNLVLNRFDQAAVLPARASATRRPIDDEAERLVARVRRAHAGHRRRRRARCRAATSRRSSSARELTGDVKVLFVAQPTRGLDVGSIEFIHQQIIALRDRGAAVLLVSAELDEILSLSDRIGVLYRGRLVGDVRRRRRDP